MKNYILFIVTVLLAIASQKINAQNFSLKEQQQLDSLNAIINNKASHDTSLAGAYVGLSEILYVSNLDTMIFLCTKAQEIAEKALSVQPSSLVAISLRKSLSEALNNIGHIHEIQGEIRLALGYYHKSLKIREEIGDKRGMANSYNNIGVIHYNQGDIPLAMEYYHKSLKVREEIGDKQGMAYSYNNIGIIYNNEGDPSITSSKEESLRVGLVLALEYFHKSLQLLEEIGKKQEVANSYHNIGYVYYDQGDILLAIEYFHKSLKIAEEIRYKQGMANYLASLCSLYLKQGALADAKKMGERGLQLARELGFPDQIERNAGLLTKIYIKEGNYKLAYEMRDLEIQMRDSLLSEENMKATVQQQAKFEYEKQQTIKDAEYEKQLAIEQEEKEKQQIITYATGGGLVLVVLFLAFVFNRLQVTKRQKTIIEEKERETHIQKEIIEEKHKEITDSINYAERIQRSFLATNEMLDNQLKQYFVFFRPKDVVSGDFYWAAELNNGNFAFSCADSTGHGVPGAIMSILNISSLEKSIEKETEADKILNQTRRIIIERLKKDGSVEGGKDGMDCSLLVLDKDRKQLSIAAANNPVFIVRNQELLEFKPDKMPVGKYEKDQTSFTLQTTHLQKGDVIYTLTDGFSDQFGGDKGKKYMVKNLKNKLLEIVDLPMHEQEQVLADEFDNWKGENEQVDDVCIIGVRI